MATMPLMLRACAYCHPCSHCACPAEECKQMSQPLHILHSRGLLMQCRQFYEHPSKAMLWQIFRLDAARRTKVTKEHPFQITLSATSAIAVVVVFGRKFRRIECFNM